MARKERVKVEKGSKKNKQDRKPLLSDRQRTVLLFVVLAMFVLVPVVDNIRCKAACLKRVKTPYPEIACKYECPWPWQKTQ